MEVEAVIKVLAADDHDLILSAITLLLENQHKYILLDKALSLISAKEKLSKLQPDILILDLNFNGKNVLDDIAELKIISKKTKILILSSYDAPFLVKEALSQGVDGYLLKDTSQEELLEALDQISAGMKYIGNSVQYARNKKEFPDARFGSNSSLSPREMEVIRMIVDSKSEQEIANNLYISKYTVHDHKKNIFRKLHIKSIAELVRYAYENGLNK